MLENPTSGALVQVYKAALWSDKGLLMAAARMPNVSISEDLMLQIIFRGRDLG